MNQYNQVIKKHCIQINVKNMQLMTRTFKFKYLRNSEVCFWALALQLRKHHSVFQILRDLQVIRVGWRLLIILGE